jgi:periplasmic protein TonB
MKRSTWAVLFSATLAAGCASTPGRKDAAVVQDPEAIQLVKIEAISAAGPVAGARCGVKNDKGGSEIVTPGVAEVIRSARPLEILCFMPGYRVSIQSIDSTGDIIGPAATGAVVGGGLSAIVALPLLTIPVMGPFMYAGAVGGSALLGGTINAADKHVKGKIYAYPPALLVTMIAYDTTGAPAFQIAAARPVVGEAIVQPAPLASPTTMETIAPAAPASALAAPLVPATPPATLMLASIGTPRRVEPPVVPLSHVIPEFPDEAAKAGVAEGRVRAQLEIDADGNVAAVRIMEAQPGRVFDRAVTETLAKWKFPRGAPDRRFEAEIEFRR